MWPFTGRTCGLCTRWVSRQRLDRPPCSGGAELPSEMLLRQMVGRRSARDRPHGPGPTTFPRRPAVPVRRACLAGPRAHHTSPVALAVRPPRRCRARWFARTAPRIGRGMLRWRGRMVVILCHAFSTPGGKRVVRRMGMPGSVTHDRVRPKRFSSARSWDPATRRSPSVTDRGWQGSTGPSGSTHGRVVRGDGLQTSPRVSRSQRCSAVPEPGST